MIARRDSFVPSSNPTKIEEARYLGEELFHGAVLPQQVVDLLLAVHRGLALAGAAEILRHLSRIVLVLFKVAPLGQLHITRAILESVHYVGG